MHGRLLAREDGSLKVIGKSALFTWILLASPGVLLAEDAQTASLEDLQITAADGSDAGALISKDVVKAALEKKLPMIQACGTVAAKDNGAVHQVGLDVDGGGAIIKVERVKTELDEAMASCADTAIQATQLPALTAADKSVHVVVTFKVKPSTTVKQAGVAEKAAAAAESATAAPSAEAVPGVPASAGSAAGSIAASGSGAPLAVSATPEGEEKPAKDYSATFTFDQSLGTGAFVSDSFAATPAYSWAFALRGSYKLIDHLKANASLSLAKQMSVTNEDSGTLPREVFFGETKLGLSASDLYKEPETGITVGPSLSIGLPTDKAGRASGRIMGLSIGGSASKTFEHLGPGDLSLSYSIGFRQNIGPRAVTISSADAPSLVASCRSFNDGGDCLTSVANPARSLSNTLGIDYTIGDFGISYSFAITNSFSYALDDSSIATLAAGDVTVGHSPNAQGYTAQSDRTRSTLEVSYTFNEYFGLAAGTQTYQSPWIQKGSDSKGLRFPFADFSSAADNLTSFYLDANVTF